MQIDIEKTIKQYENIEDTYVDAFVGIPKHLFSLENDYIGRWSDFLKEYPDFSFNKTVPLVLFVHGSSGLSKSKIFQSLIPKETNAIFFAPDSFAIKKRPSYKSPATKEEYEKVHQLRQAEIFLALNKLIKFDFIDKNNIFLLGHSEGGLAVALYQSKDIEIKGRIVTGFGCESSYFCDCFKLGAKENEPFLNIIGTKDQFFGRCSEFNRFFNVTGNGAISLQDNKNAKISILGNTFHDITQSPYAIFEVTSFINFWKLK